jgi:Ca2+-binding RTX toxin-like protein
MTRNIWFGGKLTYIHLIGLALCMWVVLVVLEAPAQAASPCAETHGLNANVSESADGSVVYGSECGDVIVVTSPRARRVIAGAGDDVVFANPDVEVVNGGEGDDVIHGDLPEEVTAEGPPDYAIPGWTRKLPVASISLTPKSCEANKSCYGGDGSQELIGSSGNDRIFGQRGNDVLYGNAGNDELFGGVGDESLISGGANNDLLSGGLGTDHLNGNQDSDLVRGDGTIDTIEDTGPSGTDTLSYATAVTPGFSGTVLLNGFPSEAESEERGANIHLDGTTCAGEFEACDNEARYGGGYDNVSVSGFENVIGSPYADVIIGSSGANRIDGGGGTDAIYGRAGNDELFGGPDGDYLSGEEGTDLIEGQGGADNCIGETANDCAGSVEAVSQRDRSKISVGYQATSLPSALSWVELFLTGSAKTGTSNGNDRVKAVYSLVGGTGYVIFTTEGESAAFDTSANAASTNCTYAVAEVKCALPKPLDAITVAGMGGTDALTLEGFPETTTPVLLGGEGSDQLTIGNGTEDMIVDGNDAGNDILSSGTYDDALIGNGGADSLQGGNGNDLLLAASNCDGTASEGDVLDGGEDGVAVNSAQWAKLPAGPPGVVADLREKRAGDTWSGTMPACTNGNKATVLANIDDLEGSEGADQLYGDGADNNLLGRNGKDEIWGRAGADRIEAKDGIAEMGGGGDGTDSCVLDTTAPAIDSFNGCP